MRIAVGFSFQEVKFLFLENATASILLWNVGGVFSFMHRLLLDYFADLNIGMPFTSLAIQSSQSPPL